MPSLSARIPARHRHLVKELTAFGVVGVINLGIDTGAFNLLHFTLGVGPLTAKILATVISATSAYLMHRHWSFSHRERTGVGREYPLFFLINGIALFMALAILGVARYGLGLEGVLALNLANLVGTVIGTVFRFLAYRRWVFPKAPEPVGPTSVGREPVAGPPVATPPG